MTNRGFDVQWRGVNGRVRKLVFEPTPDGDHMRIEYERVADTWRPVGREPVENVSLKCADGMTIGE